MAFDRRALLATLVTCGGYTPLTHLVHAHLASPKDRKRIVHKLMLGGIGGGKSEWACAEMALTILANPGGWFLVAAPTYDQAVNVLRPRLESRFEAFEHSGFPLADRWNNQQQVCELACGGKLFLRTYGKVGNLLGFEFTAALLDEIDTVLRPVQVWETIKGRIRKPGAAWREMFGATTPRGLSGVTEIFHRNREAAKASGDSDSLLAWYWARALGRENPYLPEDYIPSLRAAMSGRQWRQEVEAEILQPETAVWPEFSRDTHARPYTFTSMLPYDIAYDAGDQWPHVLFVQRTPWGDVVFDELCPDGWSTAKLHDEILKKVSGFQRQPEFCVGDRAVKSELAWMAEAFPRATIRRMITRAEQSVSEGIELVRARLDPLEGAPKLLFAESLWRQPPRRGIVKCMAEYRYKVRVDGSMTSEPLKNNIHDHGADALRMLCVALYGADHRAWNVSRTH